MLIDIQVSTILSHRTKQGMVEFTISEQEEGDTIPERQIKTQWDISKAREIQHMIGEAIEAAISDTVIFKFMKERVGLSDEKAAMALVDFRELRQGSKGTVYPS